jgi:hypothetical protein
MCIMAEQKLHHCSDGRIKKKYLLSEPFTRETALRMTGFGTMNILDFLPKPLFTLVRKPGVNMRAVMGENTLEIWYDPASLAAAEPEIYRLIAGK